MTSDLYSQAIADAKQLREIAEQNAKNAIIQSITPKIRELIDSQILGESNEGDEADILESVASEEPPALEYDMTPESIDELKKMLESVDQQDEPPDEPRQENSTEKINEAAEYLSMLNDLISELKEVDPSMLSEDELSKHVALVAIADKSSDKIIEMINSLNSAKIFESVVKNSHDQIHNLKKEIKEMKRSLRDLLSEEVITIELDLGEDAVVDSEDVSVKVKEEEELISGDSDVEVDVEDEVEEVEDVEDVEVEEEVELEEMLLELEVEEEVEEGEEDLSEGLDDDTVLEIDENMLREELAKLMQESEPTAEEEVLEETTAEPVATEQNDELQAELTSYQSAVTDLQSQLAEMSLFNAKLLYTNKLLMNSDLSQTQRAQAIETLDDAASLREVKLLFKTLIESFSKRVEENASSRNIGGASRPTQSASMNLNESRESNETRRWALLAGIK
jgi:hypothetical protein